MIAYDNMHNSKHKKKQTTGKEKDIQNTLKETITVLVRDLYVIFPLPVSLYNKPGHTHLGSAAIHTHRIA